MNENINNNDTSIPNQEQTNVISNVQTPKTNNIELVDPFNPDKIIKVETLYEKKPEEYVENEVPDSTPKKKKSSKKLLIIIILIIVIIGLGIFLVLQVNKNQKVDVPNVLSYETTFTKTISLNDIVDNFNNNSLLKQMNNYQIIANIVDNNLVITLTADDEDKTYEFSFLDRNLSIDLNDELGLNLFLIVADSIGAFYGLNENEVYTYLNSIDITDNSIEGITVNESSNGYLYSIDVDKKIDTSPLNTMYIELSDLQEYSDAIVENEVIQISKGKVLLYEQADENGKTFIVAEKDQLTSLTYNTILSIVELLYPNEINSFKTSYPTIETIAFDRYLITVDPTLSNDFALNEYQNEYKFIEIRINNN